MLVDFVGYAEDCIVRGRLEVSGGRVSDTIDRSDWLTIHDARVVGLHGSERLERRELVLERDDLLVMHAGGPAGERARRVRTVRHRLRAEVGPYSVLGEIHVLPGGSPLRSIRARRRIMALTSATILVPGDHGMVARHSGMLLVNAAHINAVQLIATDDAPWEIQLPSMSDGRTA